MTKSFTNRPSLNCENTMFETNAWRTFRIHLLLCTFFSKLGLNFGMSCSLHLVVQFLLFGKVALNLATNILHRVWFELNCVFSFSWCAKKLHHDNIMFTPFIPKKLFQIVSFYMFLPHQNGLCMFTCHVGWIKIVHFCVFLVYKKIFQITWLDHGTCWKMWKCIMASISIVEQMLVVYYKIA